MRKRAIRFPVEWVESVAVAQAGNEVLGGFCRLEAWSVAHETDGLVPMSVAAMFMGAKSLERAVKHGLLSRAEGADGVLLQGFLDRNRSAEEQNRINLLRAQAGSVGGKNRWKGGE